MNSQTKLVNNVEKDECNLMENLKKDYGTFKDARRLPVHRWFEYPAGYSPKFVEEKIKEFELKKGALLFDPFLGSGTTCLAAKERGFSSIGIEAHSFVANIAEVKLNLNYNKDFILKSLNKIISSLGEEDIIALASKDYGELPELLNKCYSEKNLINLLKIKNAIGKGCEENSIKGFFNLALTATLRKSSSAGTGWPYIAPTKYGSKKSEKDGILVFTQQVKLMAEDVHSLKERYPSYDLSTASVILGDSRKLRPELIGKIDLALTSPPYLNNFDYADRTRLETYFFGITKNWGDITKQFRNKLIVAATTQTHRKDFSPQNSISKEIMSCAPSLAKELTKKVIALSQARLQKGGKKSYDVMVANYFNDLYPIIKNTFLYLKKNGGFVLVLGDSAPYGVHIPTELYIGELGKAIGFKDYKIEEIRKRGGKWANNPQRHTVPLRESILTFYR